jgi:hypothetical protein
MKKTCRDSYVSLDLSMHVNKNPIHLMTQSLQKEQGEGPVDYTRVRATHIVHSEQF